MLFFCLYLLSMLFSNRELVLSERVYHIIPSLGDVCPRDPCLTLSQFADNSSIYTDTNTTLIFTPGGIHSFNYGSLVFIENVDTISMFSHQTSTVVSLLWIGFISVTNVFIDNLTFVHCNFHFDRVEMLVVENSVFLNNTQTLLELERSTNAYIANSRFISNSGGPERFTINGSSRSYFTGAVVIMRSLSTLVCKHCSFHQNIAEVGGVVYARLNCNLTFIDCNFVSNHASKFGGVFYVENFCTLSIKNSSFHSNSALSMAGVLAIANSTNVEIFCSMFTNNIAGCNGGIIHTNDSCITISESMFSNCTADNGGVIASIGSTILIQESVFHHNKVDDNGGVIFAVKKHNNQGGYIRITESDFVCNSAMFGGVLLSEGTSVSFIDCRRIESNRAGIGGVMWTMNVYQTIISGSVLYNNTAELAGGALTFSSNPIVNISHSQLIGNSADEGGAVFVEDHSNLSINNCNFVSNTATEIGGAICVQITCHFVIATSLIRNNSAQYGAGIFCSDKSSVTTSNIIATQNNVTKQGTLYFVESIVTFSNITNVSDNTGSLFFFYSTVAFRDTMIIDSGTLNKLELTTVEGGAVTAFWSVVDLEGLIMLRYNSASNGGAIHASSSKLHVRSKILVSNNSALVSGGGIYLYQSELDCVGQSSLELIGNKAIDRGGGIHAISSTLTTEHRSSPSIPYVGSMITLISNRADWVGGGICLENNAKIKVINLGRRNFVVRGYTIGFYGNSAGYCGGALYVADNTISGTCASASHQVHSMLTECFLQIPQLSISTSFLINQANARAHIEFVNNYAAVRGSNLYGGLLDRCTQNPLNEITKTRPNTTNGLQHLMELSNINSSDSISSDPVRICFCQSDKPDCTYQPPTVNVTKGGRFGVSLVAVDQAGHIVSAAIHGVPESDQSGIGEGQLIQKTANECTNLTYNVSSPHNDEELVIYANGPCKDAPLSQKRIQIKFLSCTCPIGFQPNLQDAIRCACECDSKLKGYVTRCNFTTQSLVRQGQPWISYIQTVPTNFSNYLIYPFCPLNYCKDNAEVILSTQNGIDAQCAAFRTGTLCGACQSHYTLSLGSIRCLKCPSYWPIIFVVILVASFLAGLALVMLILVLNLTVAVGTLNGVIFYANIVYANIHTYHPDNWLSFATVFVSWLNLDIGIDVCFVKGMNAYWKTWLQLIFPSYVFFLVLMVIVISNRSMRFSELIGKKNPVATLATLILLSYAKLLHIIIMAFSSATLSYPGPFGGYKRKVWLPDATVDFLEGKHVPLFLAALLVLLVGIVYTTLIFSWQWLQQFNKEKNSEVDKESKGIRLH